MKSVALPKLKVYGYSKAKTVLQVSAFAVMLSVPWSTFAQSGGKVVVSGQVLDADGLGVPGGAVKVLGTTQGTLTDVDGKFSIEVEETATIEISSVGYETQDVPVKGQNDFVIKMQNAKKNSLNDVVVIGYGSQKKSDVTGSTVSVGAEAIKQSPVTNTAQALQGRASGVNVQYTSSRPGADAQIRIRGERSLTSSANNPLIVLDGIPFSGTINDINTNDIKSIDILKDASATAIYGSRGANGVIIITTNRGGVSRPRISYNGYQGIGTVAKKYPVYNGEEFNAMRQIANNAKDPTTPTYSNSAAEAAQLAAGKTTDWQDLMYKNSRIGDHQVNVTGGTEATKYSMGLGYHNETAAIPGQDFTRYSLHLSVDQDLGSRVRVGVSTQTNYSIINGESASMQNALVTLSPLAPAKDSTGKPYTLVPLTTTDAAQYYNPLLALQPNNWKEQRKRTGTFNSVYGEVKILDGLKYRMNVGLNATNDNYGEFIAAVSPYNAVGQPNNATVSNANTSSYVWENIVTYDKAIKKHKFGVTGLYSLQQDKATGSSFYAQNIVSDQLQYNNLGLSNSGVQANASSQSESTRGLESYMLRLNYNYDDRYLLTVTGRRDGSSVLAAGHKWNNYPAIAAAWNISNESFMKSSKNWLDALKIRVGYGQTANQAISPYQTLGSLSQNLYNFGTTNTYGYYVSTLPNPNLGWENTKTFNAGIDYSFFNSRIFGSIEAYNSHTTNVLLPVQLPATSGVPGSYLSNVGETSNKGLEFNVSTANIRKANGFNWTTDLNVFFNRNKIVSLASGQTQDIGNGWFVGQPINVIYDYQKTGIWQTADATTAATYGQKPGGIRVADLNGDGKIDGNDQKVIGNFQSKFEGGITNRFAYKAFDLTVVAYGRYGGTLISTINQPQSYANTLSGRRNGIKVDYWTPANPTNDNPEPLAPGDNPQYGSTLGYFSATYLQIRTISLGYHIKNYWMKKIGGESGYVYFSVNNVGTLFSPYMKAGGVSPEANGTGGQGQAGIGAVQSRQLTVGLNTPPLRSFLVGVRISY
jgi:TonB-linked SusC/RagA family outer membrane protein